MEINATGQLVIKPGVKVSLRGGTVFTNPLTGANYSGGAGSGGALKLIGSSIENLGLIDVRGGMLPGPTPVNPPFPIYNLPVELVEEVELRC